MADRSAAVRTEVAKPMIDTLKQGQLVFAYYPDPKWLQGSQFLGCGSDALARAKAGASQG